MRAQTKSEILDFIRKSHRQLITFGVSKIGLFGSFVKNQQTEDSDIDILVDFHPDKFNYDNYIDLAYYLEDSLEPTVDLVTVNRPGFTGDQIL